MGQPIHLQKGAERITLHGKNEAAKYVLSGWQLADESIAVTLPPPPINATDAAKVLADEYGINLSGIRGTGTDGRITANDVRGMIG